MGKPGESDSVMIPIIICIIVYACCAFTYRYATMLRCWVLEDQERPNFSQLAAAYSRMLELEAGYLDMNPNPFAAGMCLHACMQWHHNFILSFPAGVPEELSEAKCPETEEAGKLTIVVTPSTP